MRKFLLLPVFFLFVSFFSYARPETPAEPKTIGSLNNISFRTLGDLRFEVYLGADFPLGLSDLAPEEGKTFYPSNLFPVGFNLGTSFSGYLNNYFYLGGELFIKGFVDNKNYQLFTIFGALFKLGVEIKPIPRLTFPLGLGLGVSLASLVSAGESTVHIPIKPEAGFIININSKFSTGLIFSYLLDMQYDFIAPRLGNMFGHYFSASVNLVYHF